MLTKHSRTTTAAQPLRVKWIALALPLAITAGCSSVQNRDIIDYTISEAEYLALTEPAQVEPAQAEEVFASSSPAPSASPQESSQIELAAATANVANTAQSSTEPMMAAAKPAPALAAPSIAAVESIAVEKAAQMMDHTPAAMQEAAMQEPEMAAAFDIDKLNFSPAVYASAGLGVSRMNPDTSAAPGWFADEKIAAAGQLSVGVDLHKHLSVELHSADYGSTGLSPEGRVNFHVNGVSALLYAGGNVDRFRRRGLSGYARLGFNQVKNTPIGNVPFIEQTSQHASFGLGAEYNTRRGLGFRADVVAYDGDVQFGQLGVVYRVAKKPKRPKLAAANELPDMQAPAMAAMTDPQMTKQEMMKPQMTNSEMTGPDLAAAQAAPASTRPVQARIINTQDFQLPRYESEYATADQGCQRLNGTLSNVNFLNGSAVLTQGASLALDNIALTLADCSNSQIVVSAHTDNTGSAASNSHLSKLRARAVAVHLARRGVDMNRMRAVAYGESRPVASNATQDGRTRNRRVELEVR